MSVKLRLGLILLGAGIILLVIFLALLDPNALLRRNADDGEDAPVAASQAGPVDAVRLAAFLDAYNRRYLELEPQGIHAAAAASKLHAVQ